MKKLICILFVLAFCLVPLSAGATPDGPVITMQPQSPSYPEYSVAIYTVKAEGENLTATWYIEYEGKTYNASQIGGAMQPWEAYAGESYGAKTIDDNTFAFVFEGIGKELSGAQIWCVIEDGHYDVPSTVAYITVGDYATPPEILDIPSSITAQQGAEAEIRCIAKSSDESQLSFTWYVSDSGLLPDIRSVDRGEETSDFLLCSTEYPGTYYYICGITTSAGGAAYSSPVEVIVTEKTATPEPTVPTETTAETQPTQAETKDETTPATTAPAPQVEPQEKAGIPWWVFLLVAVGTSGVGVVVAIILIKKKQEVS